MRVVTLKRTNWSSTTLSTPTRERSRLRLERMGVVFQFGDLVPELTLVENVMLPLQLLGHRRRTAQARARELLGVLGIADLADARTGAVSGGQAQRAAVARAMVHEPAIVLADEPTGSLDSISSEAVLDALPSPTLLLDSGGTVLLANSGWATAAELLADDRVRLAVGEDYYAMARQLREDEVSREIVASLQELSRGERETRLMTHMCAHMHVHI